ncbi:hypothetical protein [Streptomyces sp. NPDC047525]|uniref:hypothetical protein n=1 Tax=Streptomyces sp. NPDC047525 TaxID=3155264 RepID=UPI0033DC334E
MLRPELLAPKPSLIVVDEADALFRTGTGPKATRLINELLVTGRTRTIWSAPPRPRWQDVTLADFVAAAESGIG